MIMLAFPFFAAKYSVPTIISKPEGITQDSNTDGTLICNSEGGYPGGQLRWFKKDSVDWTKSAKMETKKQQNGLFQLSSSLTLLRGSIFSKYTCVVFNASGDKVEEVTFETHGAPQTEGTCCFRPFDSILHHTIKIIFSAKYAHKLMLYLKSEETPVSPQINYHTTSFSSGS